MHDARSSEQQPHGRAVLWRPPQIGPEMKESHHRTSIARNDHARQARRVFLSRVAATTQNSAADMVTRICHNAPPG